MLIDDSGTAISIVSKSYKSERVTRYVLSPEFIAFTDLFDDAFSIRSQIEHALRRCLALHLLTDSISLFDIISKGSRTREKRIMLDTYATRESYENQETSNIGFVRSNHNLADGLTKPNVQVFQLQLLQTGRQQFKREQWILRTPKLSKSGTCPGEVNYSPRRSIFASETQYEVAMQR